VPGSGGFVVLGPLDQFSHYIPLSSQIYCAILFRSYTDIVTLCPHTETETYIPHTKANVIHTKSKYLTQHKWYRFMRLVSLANLAVQHLVSRVFVSVVGV
jgi:hypothetical protein